MEQDNDANPYHSQQNQKYGLQDPFSDALVFFFQLLLLTIFVILSISKAFLCHVVAKLSTLDLVRWNLPSEYCLPVGVLFDVIDLTLGFFGLYLCWKAQLKMGNSWRVSIERQKDMDQTLSIIEASCSEVETKNFTS